MLLSAKAGKYIYYKRGQSFERFQILMEPGRIHPDAKGRISICASFLTTSPSELRIYEWLHRHIKNRSVEIGNLELSMERYIADTSEFRSIKRLSSHSPMLYYCFLTTKWPSSHNMCTLPEYHETDHPMPVCES